MLGILCRQFMQTTQDGGFRPGVAEFNPHRIDAGVDAAGEQGVPRNLDHCPIYAAPCHG
ncbi:hypothetical protein D3C78_610300 [compost metagenome]